MNYYWYDRYVQERGRNQSEQSDIFKGLIRIFQPQSVFEASELQAADQPFICFVHPGTGNGCMQNDFENVADKNQQRFVAFVGYESDRLPEKKDGSVVSLKRVCLKRGLDRIDRIQEVIEIFKKSAEAGQPKWELLAPELETEHLIALYLLLLAQQRGIGVDVPPGLRAEAYTELQEIAKNHLSSGVVPPVLAEGLDHSYLERIGKLLSECVCK